MRKKTYLAFLLMISMMAAGCGSQDSSSVSIDGSVQTAPEKDAVSEGGTSENLFIKDASEVFSKRDFEVEYEESKSAVIRLNGDSAACDSDAVRITDSTVMITDEGTYILSGTLDDGMIVVNTDKSDKVQLVLDNVTIHSETGAPIYVLQSDKVFITQASGSTNTLSNGGIFTAIDENNIDAVVFSKEDVTFNGSGTMIITSPAGHGIVSKDSLKITGGSFDINCASHAISGKDDVCITSADFTIVSGKDGIHAENADDTSLGYIYMQSGSFHISAEGDGISASSYLQIENGSFDITAGGGSVNASAHHSDSWGDFRGGGMHGGGQWDRGGQKDKEMPGDGEFRKGGSVPEDGGAPRDGDVPEEGNVPGDGEFRRDGGVPEGGSVPRDGAFHRNGNAPEDGDAFKDGNPPELPADASNIDAISSATKNADSADNSNDSTSMKGIKAAVGLIINGGEFTIDSADDSFHSNGYVTVNGGSFEIASGDDAFHADETLTVTAGTVNITESYEGLEGYHVNVYGGDITLTAQDDGLNAACGTDSSGSTGGRDGMFGHGMSSSGGGSITISGGTLKITASGDGIDANGTLDITGGNTIVCGPTQGDTAILDYDVSGTISGGTFIGTGASNMMTQTFSDSEQGVISVSVGNQPAGTQIQLSDSNGNILLTYTPELNFAFVIFSSPEISGDEIYTLTAGTYSGEFTAGRT